MGFNLESDFPKTDDRVRNKTGWNVILNNGKESDARHANQSTWNYLPWNLCTLTIGNKESCTQACTLVPPEPPTLSTVACVHKGQISTTSSADNIGTWELDSENSFWLGRKFSAKVNKNQLFHAIRRIVSRIFHKKNDSSYECNAIFLIPNHKHVWFLSSFPKIIKVQQPNYEITFGRTAAHCTFAQSENLCPVSKVPRKEHFCNSGHQYEFTDFRLHMVADQILFPSNEILLFTTNFIAHVHIAINID